VVWGEDGGEEGWWWLWVGGHCWWWEVVGVWMEVDGSFIDKDGNLGSSSLRQTISLAWSHILFTTASGGVCTIFYICPPLASSSASAQAWARAGYSDKFYPCSESISDNRKTKILPPRSMPLQPLAAILRLCPMLPTHFLPPVLLQESRIIVTQVSTLIAQLFSL